MLMPPTLSKTGLPFQSKTSGPAERSGSGAQSGAKRHRLGSPQSTKDNYRPIDHFRPKSSSFFSTSSTDSAYVSHEKPRISFLVN